MTQDSDQEIEGLIDGMADELRGKSNQANHRRSRSTIGDMGPNRSLIFLGVIVLVVIAVIIVLFRGGGTGISPDDLKAIQGKLGQLDERMTRIEGLMDGVPEVGRQMESIRQDIERMDRSLKNLNAGIKRADKKIEALQKKPASSGDVSKPSQKRYHTVRSGDTLFGIAKKYGLTVDDLRRLNSKLGKNGTIVPGQKLLVGPL